MIQLSGAVWCYQCNRTGCELVTYTLKTGFTIRNEIKYHVGYHSDKEETIHDNQNQGNAAGLRS
jgi:hypothetical protein